MSICIYTIAPCTPSAPRNDGTTHSYETSVSFFYMHFGHDVIAKADRFTRAFEDYRAEHCLLLG
jgi:hypothetical protein